MRAVDPAWPAPVRVSTIRSDCGRSSSTTTPRFSRRSGKSLTLLARAKAFGRARIEIQVRPDGVGSVIEMGEHLASPPMSWFPQSVVELAAVPRNRECIRRLALLAEGPAHPRDGSTAPRLG